MSTIEYQNYINGQFVPASDFIEVFNPSTGELLAKSPESDDNTVSAAVDAANAAQPAWAALPAIERGKYLIQIASALRENHQKFQKFLMTEQGKTPDLAATEVSFTADYLEYMAGFARRIEGEVIPSDRPGEQIFLTYQPLGVVAGILPWNFPLFLVARKFAPAAITDNTIVIKPSEETPIVAFEFASLVDQVEVPRGVFNMVGGSGASVGNALTTSAKVNMVSMTGSVKAGKAIMAAAAPNLTRVNLELGGKAPAIVLDDANLDLAAEAIWNSRVINTGQVCNCAEVVLVQESVHDELVAKLKTKFEATRFDDPSKSSEIDMGPLINRAASEKVQGMVDRALSEGATLVTGGQAPEGFEEGNFYQPTIITNVESDSEIARDEIFGPVLPVVKVRDLDEALDIANSSKYGLTSSVYTENLNLAMKASRELLYGETYINRENFEAMQGFHAGRRQSGIGGADGKHGVMEFVETHTVYIQSQL
ncbi:MAG TPA: aldehyde dehydrogenase [Corynebacterium stationis]|uniref:aldehyde dehydrogenase n=1 Tax=Corynebacterium stationis TaxID=1705 RepID=UPI001DF64335|nr:aldehyde dehydrogenase [Corynebacterium stationis]HJG65141.1 aldehyde dehydrogenase [Corynebacterium stationis]